jgi:dipeptidase D
MSLSSLPKSPYWKFFIDLNAVPRASKKEEAIRQHVIDFAKERKLDWEEDEVGNILIKKPAAKGFENRPTIALQGHLDMVHQKNGDVDFDFATQGIDMYVDGDWLRARGTTLGADNGLGVAAILAILDDTQLKHPALEALFTIDEETGMTGAMGLQQGWLKAKYLLNLDTEEEDEITIGCAGGVDTLVDHQLKVTSANSGNLGLKVSIKGLFGGHSGTDIHTGRANANKLLFRLLNQLQNRFAFGLSEVDGGGLRNAIPREAFALLSVPKDQMKDLILAANELTEVFSSEYSTTDPGLKVVLEEVKAPDSILDAVVQRQLILAIESCFNGVFRLSPDVDYLVETSSNLARLKLKDGTFNMQSLQRSSRESAKLDVSEVVAAPFEMLGAMVRREGSYPGWTPSPSSKLVEVLAELHREVFQREPKVLACHAGLECGLIGKAMPDAEMISFGPTIRNAHSPDECAHIPAAERVWNYLLKALETID